MVTSNYPLRILLLAKATRHRPWSPLDWTASDDRVRGGSSVSELSCHPSSPTAVFHGHLDIKTLGGAGFASQRTTGEARNWDLSRYDGLLLDVERSDGKRYTLTLKDELLPRSPNGREQSTTSWEYDFEGTPDGGKVFVRWDDLKATYRGREKKDAPPLDRTGIKRFSLLMRRYGRRSVWTARADAHSFFGTQEGDFSLSIVSISAFQNIDPGPFEPYRDDPNGKEVSRSGTARPHTDSGWLGWLFGRCAAV